jgi:hypothetical protein
MSEAQTNTMSAEQIAEQKAAAKAAADAARAEAKAKKEQAAAEAKAARDAAKAEAKAKADQVKAEKKAADEAAKKARAEERAKKAAEKAAEAGVKKEKVVMPSQNGITRPKPETKCARIWQLADEISTELKQPTPISYLEKRAKEEGFNEATIRTQYARWKTFNGVFGPVAKPAVAPAATEQAAA